MKIIPQIASFLVLIVIGCDTGDMKNQGRLKPLEPSEFFPAGQSARPPVAGTVPRGPAPIAFDRTSNVFPMPLTADLLARGHERYEIFCTPCHGATGEGDGMIVRRGFTAPPSFHLQRLREAPAGHFVDVITNGYGAMYSYGDRVAMEDRWAIAAYVRALQLSRRVPLEALNADERQKAGAP